MLCARCAQCQALIVLDTDQATCTQVTPDFRCSGGFRLVSAVFLIHESFPGLSVSSTSMTEPLEVLHPSLNKTVKEGCSSCFHYPL